MKSLLTVLAFVFCFVPITFAITIADHLLSENSTNNSNSSTNHSSSAREKALAKMLSEQNADSLEKSIQIKVSELKDNSGLVYIGGKVTKAELFPYLDKLKNILGNDYANYRENQAIRDHQSFHVTLINPYEYQKLNAKDVKINQRMTVRLHGLGKAAKDGKTAYFVVASSSDGQYYRQKLRLQPKDFHVTLGFKPTDVFGVSKARDSLIK